MLASRPPLPWSHRTPAAQIDPRQRVRLFDSRESPDPNLQENNLGEELAEEIAVSATRIEWDTQGRFVLSKDFTAKLGAEKNEVLFTGGISHLKLWTEADYTAANEQKAASKQSEEYKAARKAALKR